VAIRVRRDPTIERTLLDNAALAAQAARELAARVPSPIYYTREQKERLIALAVRFDLEGGVHT
jgi:hypothetical protein